MDDKGVGTTNHKVDIMTKNVSDHNLISQQTKGKLRNCKIWRINEDLYKQDIVDQIKQDLKMYFEISAAPTMRLGHTSAVVRGGLISKDSLEEKIKNEKRDLQKQLSLKKKELKNRLGKKEIRETDKTLKRTNKKSRQSRSFMGAEETTTKVF